MARPDLKRLLQRVAVRTQFPPFVWLYRAVYALAVRLCVRRLGRVRGVRSIYLRRGLASGRAVYGLSDVDLLVMVEKDAEGSAAARVRHQYALLRRLIPMLPEEHELALYDPAQFRMLYERNSFYRHRFDTGRREWRRLYGDDVFSILPPYAGEERQLAVQELRPAWYYLAQELLPDDERPAFVRRYVAQKWIAETARVALLAAGREVPARPEAAIAEAAALHPQIAGKLEAFRRPFDHRAATRCVCADDLLGSYVHLARAAFSALPARASAVRKLRVARAPREAIELLLPKGALAAMAKACAALPGVERAVLVPRLCFETIGTLDMEPSELAGASVDAFDLVLVGRQLPPAGMLREFNRAIEPFAPAVNAFFCDGALAVSLRPIRGWTVADAAGAPEFFACLSSAGPLEGILQAAGPAETERAFEQPDALEFRARSLLDLFGDGEAYRLPIRDFLTLFWEAGRAALLAAQPADPVLRVPVSSAQVVDALAGLTPWAEAVLRRIWEEYRREVRGEPSDAPRYTQWMAAYAGRLRERLSSPGAATEIPGPVRTELTISVVIVTRNRAGMLRRALQSLAAQQRPPDQVVVVDNASTDETASVALSFAGAYELELVREERVGIPYARNTGVAHCTGDVIAFLDDDCEATPGWLAALEVPFLKDPHVGAVGGPLMPFEEVRKLVARFFDTRLRAALAEGSARPR